jgi:outer membrane receptor for ferrienterochelin and colicin
MKYYFYLLFLILPVCADAQSGEIHGTVIDRATGDPMVGANVVIKSANVGVSVDIDGNYRLKAPPGVHTLQISYISYKTLELTDVRVEAGKVTEANAMMEEAAAEVGEVVVYAVRKMNSEMALLSGIRAANMVMSGVSAQQIARTQDRDASEVVKRSPGISIIDNRFIIARGLSQRYNNVWVNNSAVPSSEADSRAFSFDMIPSGQIENIMIVKSPAPELPSDFSGGFVKVATKSVPEENSVQVSYGININTKAHFRDFNYAKGSPTDFLGFDNGFRGMRSVAPSFRMDDRDAELVTAVTVGGFNNDWTVHTRKPVSDQRFSFMLNRFKLLRGGGKVGVTAALNYSYSSLAYRDMVNARFGIYNKTEDIPVYLYKYADDQYTSTARTGGMLNFVLMLSTNHRLEFRNIFNQYGRDRYTFRDGWQNISSYYEQVKQEYFYSSRGAYTGQLSGCHTLSETGKLDWTAGYSYANRNQPDRRQIDLDGTVAQSSMTSIIRDFNRLDENTWSAAMNYNRIFAIGTFAPALKAGVYTEYRSRVYNTRYFLYKVNFGNLPPDFLFRDVATGMMRPEYFAADRFYISDASDKTNDYMGDDLLASGYAGVNIPVGPFSVYAGARYENNAMTLNNYTNITTDDTETFNYGQSDIFPSVNATWNINKTNLLRLACGKSINRQEFREVSPSTYYDFDLFSFVRGNKKLRQAYIQNYDLRYEIYPSDGEMISIALFYKQFVHPIEWTFIDAGGTYTFTFENAGQANNYGVELELKKSLDFAGLPDLSLSFNGALIRSKVVFGEGSQEHDRPMQGQSPYIVNAGLFYRRDNLNAGLMYNIIGKRIVGIGRSDNSQGGSIDNDIPDMFEMPRHAIDLSLSRKLGEHVELSVGARDILAMPCVYMQFPKFVDASGKISTREQTTKAYKPGQNFSIAIKYGF